MGLFTAASARSTSVPVPAVAYRALLVVIFTPSGVNYCLCGWRDVYHRRQSSVASAASAALDLWPQTTLKRRWSGLWPFLTCIEIGGGGIHLPSHQSCLVLCTRLRLLLSLPSVLPVTVRMICIALGCRGTCIHRHKLFASLSSTILWSLDFQNLRCSNICRWYAGFLPLVPGVAMPMPGSKYAHGWYPQY